MHIELFRTVFNWGIGLTTIICAMSCTITFMRIRSKEEKAMLVQVSESNQE